MSTIYALLVGIADYEPEIKLADERISFPKLSGCISDVGKMRNYLERYANEKIEIEVLTDKKASKAEIVRLFTEHLGRATEGDIALFYFSGHGTQEKAAPFFTAETDGKLESLVCYYNKQNKDDFLLADKELRYLIKKLSSDNPHILTIFDCCHSAGITRNGGLVTSSFAQVVEKRIPFIFPQRDLDQFIFGKEITEKEIYEKGESTALSEGLHVELSACESNESAVEVAGEGVFTKALLKILTGTRGNVSYYSLHSRIKQYLQNIYEQKPRIYIPGNNYTLLYRCFLNKPLDEQSSVFAEVSFNDKLGWLLNLGAIHGVKKSTKTLRLFDPDDKRATFQAKIGVIKADSSEVISEGLLNKEKVYYAYIEASISQIINIHVAEGNSLLDDQKRLLDEIHNNVFQKIIFQDEEQNADYVLRFLNGSYFVTYPNDPFRPLFKPVEVSTKSASVTIAGYLNHISRWEFIRNIKNQDESTGLSNDSLRIDVFIGGQLIPESSNDDMEAVIKFTKVDNEWRNTIRIRLTNSGDRNLYCCPLYLVSTFESNPKFLSPSVYLLEKGNTVELSYENMYDIPVYLDEVMKWYNWEAQIDHVKFLISTEVFDEQALVLEPLPPPDLPGTQSLVGRRGIGERPGLNRGRLSSWYTKDLRIELQNPEFNIINESDLKLMLEDDSTSDFALGLYYDGIVDENLQGGYKLKSSILLKDSEDHLAERGIVQDKVIDIANWWARKRRNQLYERTLDRFPNRIRIVSEGDSWFQHPLVLDIIDHLCRTYAVYCTAAAADTLRNYFSKEKTNGEYYLDAIEEKKPSFFLISGGGNDILGSQFQNFLSDSFSDNRPEGEDPQRFLKSSLFDEIGALMKIYQTVFNHLKVNQPEVHIIVHGYDYPIKLNDPQKGWLGRYMIEKGINRPGDRRAIIKHIMDYFNDRLKQLVSNFNNVSYIDIRNLTRYDEVNGVDQWFDEIHPNNDGFQQIAMRFIQEIDELIKKKSKIEVN